MRTTEQLRRAWTPACRLNPSVRFAFWTGVAVLVDGRIVPALAALDDILLEYRYGPLAGQTWGYNCRKITGGVGYSLHAYGIAVDVNSLANPYGPRLVTDMPPAMIEAIEGIRTAKGLPVWRWGGRYSGNKDAMHFEIVASPAELAAGLAPRKPPTRQEASIMLNKPVVKILPTLDDGGYWLIAGDGGVFAFGNAAPMDPNPLPGMKLNGDIIDAGGTPTGRGMWLLGADGGVFALGDAGDHGSLGAVKLNAPVVAITPTLTGGGYWIATADGGVFTFGDAPFHGTAAG